MSAFRYSGSLVIRLTIVDDRTFPHATAYRCSILDAAEGTRYVVTVGAPAHLTHAVDSPPAFDSAAHAALSFLAVDDCSAVDANHGAYADKGWHVSRSHADRYVPKVRKPCNGSHMVRASFDLQSGQSFDCYVSPVACLVQAHAIARAVDACFARLTSPDGSALTYTKGSL